MDPETIKETRQKAISQLERHGITGADVYFIDIIPLIEMIWADGKVQKGELEILVDFLNTHVARINRVAGYQLLTLEKAREFVKRFLRSRPDADLLKTLRSLIGPLRLASSEEELNLALRNSVLAACLDIASSCVLKYPYGIGDRFNAGEKVCLFEILNDFYHPPAMMASNAQPEA